MNEETEKQLKDPREIVEHIRDIYKPNHFMSDYFHIHIDEIRCGEVTVSLIPFRKNIRITEAFCTEERWLHLPMR